MNRGEIWNVNFNPANGDEIQKTRPAIIISSDEIKGLKLKAIIPILEVRKPQSRHIKIIKSKSNGLAKDSHADTFQIKSVSTDRFVKKMGVLTEEELADIGAMAMLVLGLL
ncbi:type II toxin-antitoxin system PemK/MazF family toxin [Flammeovirga kamogawensis]|uniref:mRNA interferase n=1 Tax=Flammeovirga kamogawensis TaxID=373891 RepID=A0ABX8H6G4_9BACT|nr:type II toxin-antitoxin system PemK/MazF family toxin [Flammeovirga kamogawensis]MBB6463850.1 mRNA interferase MazF [Flammeovirga kamogawensis]QWG10775.1 type II toxin-antitoxin system PemK/MazF family toxin [Flammeovirga kamogawensis]